MSVQEIDKELEVTFFCNVSLQFVYMYIQRERERIVWKISHTMGNSNAFWIYNDKPINKLSLFVLNRFHKDQQGGNRLVIRQTTSTTSKMNQRDATLGDVKKGTDVLPRRHRNLWVRFFN